MHNSRGYITGDDKELLAQRIGGLQSSTDWQEQKAIHRGEVLEVN